MNEEKVLLNSTFFEMNEDTFIYSVGINKIYNDLSYDRMDNYGHSIIINGEILSWYSYSVKDGEVLCCDFVFEQSYYDTDSIKHDGKLKIEIETNGLGLWEEKLFLIKNNII